MAAAASMLYIYAVCGIPRLRKAFLVRKYPSIENIQLYIYIYCSITLTRRIGSTTIQSGWPFFFSYFFILLSSFSPTRHLQPSGDLLDEASASSLQRPSAIIHSHLRQGMQRRRGTDEERGRVRHCFPLLQISHQTWLTTVVSIYIVRSTYCIA